MMMILSYKKKDPRQDINIEKMRFLKILSHEEQLSILSKLAKRYK